MVNSEATNTDKMAQHRLSKSKVNPDAFRHDAVDLMVCTDLIDQARTGALNASNEHASVLEIMTANPEDRALASDVDPQLMLKILFKEKVNLTAVTFRFSKPPPTSENDEVSYSKPRLVKLYANATTLDFGDVGEREESARSTVGSAEDTELKIQCSGHRFQRLESLAILIEEAHDPDATRCYLNRVSLIGHKAQQYHSDYR